MAIGVSMGGLRALAAILGALPADFALPLLIVQHVDRDAGGGLAYLLDQRCALRVKEADDQDEIVAWHGLPRARQLSSARGEPRAPRAFGRSARELRPAFDRRAVRVGGGRVRAASDRRRADRRQFRRKRGLEAREGARRTRDRAGAGGGGSLADAARCVGGDGGRPRRAARRHRARCSRSSRALRLRRKGRLKR